MKFTLTLWFTQNPMKRRAIEETRGKLEITDLSKFSKDSIAIRIRILVLWIDYTGQNIQRWCDLVITVLGALYRWTIMVINVNAADTHGSEGNASTNVINSLRAGKRAFVASILVTFLLSVNILASPELTQTQSVHLINIGPVFGEKEEVALIICSTGAASLSTNSLFSVKIQFQRDLRFRIKR